VTRSLPDFSGIGFSGQLRPSQLAAVSVIEPELAASGKKLHIVAPPGSGKTVLGLYVWSTLVRKPTLVLSPNSAIQAQWAARTSLFDLNGKEAYISTDPQNPGILTSLTYQSITMPRRGGEDFDAAALELWANSLMESGEKNLAWALIRFPFMTLNVTRAIYWNALLLRLKGCPFFSHPKNLENPT